MFRLTALAAFALVALTACGTTQYVMSTKSGQMIVTDGRPELNSKTGMYEYRDSEGKRVSINKDDVVQIMER
jgi:hypothetical protein